MFSFEMKAGMVNSSDLVQILKEVREEREQIRRENLLWQFFVQMNIGQKTS
jgi:hypothetical protein